MKPTLFTLMFIFIINTLYAQNVIDWLPDYKLQVSDFQSSASQVGDGNTFKFTLICRNEFPVQYEQL